MSLTAPILSTNVAARRTTLWAAIGNPPASLLSAGVTVDQRFAVFAVGQDGALYSIAP